MILLIILGFLVFALLYSWILSKLFDAEDKKQNRHYAMLRKFRELK